ncbi:YdeI/OmpD-associated family protein [Lederbergia citri]|uniref:YdeI/OmpD-associated family protein n=1 Tax=Lederbergia citri TaxID=2833580 RepID=A0A942TG17_9BACI|nr:YdeI/OmpD-associated family protein [Lederbergia citri]MBS4196213.1 YdeI/OmpD-associated family protein [Lederbergia citri]
MTKTIVEKLNLKKYEKVAVLNLPEGADYLTELDPYDTELKESKYDLIFAFVLDMESFKELIQKVIEKDFLNKKGYIFLAYPKKGNKVYPTFIHRDEIFSSIGVDENGYVGKSNIKFARMVGLDEVFTVVGLKEESRNKKQTSSKASQRVDDYIEMIPAIEKDLEDNPDLLSFYRTLTPGYQKDWARHVYSAKQESTRNKRREEMKKILAARYKSLELYRRDQ